MVLVANRLCVCFFFFLMIRRPPRSTLFPLHDALPILIGVNNGEELTTSNRFLQRLGVTLPVFAYDRTTAIARLYGVRSEEHTSELQSRQYLVCRLLLEKKKKKYNYIAYSRTTKYNSNR